MAYLRDRRAFGNIGTRKFRGARFGDPLSPRFSGLLDQYPGAAAAYSLRRLGSYGGDVVEVRRDVDGGGDIHKDFTASDITSGAMLTWVTEFSGTANGLVSKWYDQSGFANNATQATTTAQPKIVDAGALVVGGLDFDGVDDALDAAGVVTANGAKDTTIIVGKVSGADQIFIDNLSTLDPHAIGSSSDGNFQLYADLLNDRFYGTADANENLHFVYKADVSNQSTGSLNGVVDTLNAGTDGYTGGIKIGMYRTGAGPLDGTINELIVYASDQSANRTGIETNINAAYTIY